MCYVHDHYKHIALYAVYHKLKDTDPIKKLHLRCDFFHDKESILCLAPRKYIDKLVTSYEYMSR